MCIAMWVFYFFNTDHHIVPSVFSSFSFFSRSFIHFFFVSLFSIGVAVVAVDGYVNNYLRDIRRKKNFFRSWTVRERERERETERKPTQWLFTLLFCTQHREANDSRWIKCSVFISRWHTASTTHTAHTGHAILCVTYGIWIYWRSLERIVTLYAARLNLFSVHYLPTHLHTLSARSHLKPAKDYNFWRFGKRVKEKECTRGCECWWLVAAAGGFA